MSNPVLAEWIAADQIAERHAEAEAWRRTHPPTVHREPLGHRLRTSVTAWRAALGLLGRHPAAVGCETC